MRRLLRAALVLGCTTLAVLAALEGSFALGIGGCGALIIGTLLAARVPNNRVSLALQVGGGSAVMADWSDAFTGASRVGQVAAILALSTFPLVAVGLTSLLLVFPTGHPLPGWRWLLRALVGIGTAAVVAGAIWASTLSPTERIAAVVTEADTGNPAELLSGLLFMALPVSLVSAGVRYRRSTGIERLQMRWLILGATFFFVVAVVQNVVLDFESVVSVAGTTTGFILYPLAVALAVMRYKLYDIDRIISRTVTYAVVVGALVGLFAILVTLPTLVAGAGTDPPAWLVASTTLAVIALFNPLRQRVRQAVDRRFNRVGYDAQRVIEGLGRSLRDTREPIALGDSLGGTIVEVFQPATLGWWVKEVG